MSHIDLSGAYAPDIKPDEWVPINSIDFQNWVFNTFDYEKVHNKSVGPCHLFPYQKFVKDYLQFSSPYRSLILYHGLGVGKTRSAVATAECLIDHYDVMVLLPASLKGNFLIELQKCGNSMFHLQQHWKFFDKTSDEYKSTKSILDILKGKSKLKGLWLPIPEKVSNFDKLSDDEQSEIKAQLNELMNARFRFISYNGLKGTSVDALKKEFNGNPFDNKFVIIDEVHNFISTVVGKSKPTPGVKIYQLLMNAHNLKLLLLSGTPIINKPIELSYLANLAYGYIHVYEIKYKIATIEQDEIIDALKKNEYVDYFAIKHDVRMIEFTLFPFGFACYDKKQKRIRKKEKPLSHDTIVKDIENTLVQLKLGPKSTIKAVKRSFTLLPNDEDEFHDLFIDVSSDKVVTNPMLLSRRLQGIVSYYEYYREEDYPRVLPIKYVKVPMSDEQFTSYVDARKEEIRKETAAKRRSKNNDMNENKEMNVYRAFSRAMCNWVFPPDIERPRMIHKKIKDEIDIDGDEANDVIEELKESDDVEESAAASYAKQVNLALLKLAKRKEYLQGEELKLYGPKYYQVLKYVNKSPGSALLYSVYKTVEGIKIATLVFESNGWIEFKLKKMQNGEWTIPIDPKDYNKPKYMQFIGQQGEETKMMLDIFNSDFSQLPPSILAKLKDMYPMFEAHKNLRGEMIKLITITKSGSEGISLKNVRQVHILEPYWNDIRIKQVIGRAVRAKSHVELEEQEREVEVFMYMMKLKSKQADDTLMATNDHGLTSDQYIFNIAQRKAKVNNALLKVIKNSSVDCYINSDVHESKVQCFQVPLQIKPDDDKLFYVLNDIKNDYKNAEIEQITKIVKTKEQYKEITIKGAKYLMNINDNLIYKKDDVINNSNTKQPLYKGDIVNGKIQIKKL